MKIWDYLAVTPTQFQTEEISGLLFAMLDGKDASAVAWKLTKPMITGSQPVVHGRDLL